MLRRSFTWVVPAAVVAVGVFAGLDALRSSNGEPPAASAPSASEALTTTQTERDAVRDEWSAQLQTRRAVRLIHGRVTTNERFPITVTFTVPPGWYGYQDGGGFMIGKSRSRILAQARNVSFGGIAVDILDQRLADVVKDLEMARDVVLHQDSPVRIGGYSGLKFGLDVRVPRLRGLLGVPGVFSNDPNEQVILLGVGPQTLLIHKGSDSGDPERLEVNDVLSSFRVTTPEQEIEQTGNRWARLFASGRTCNRFMHQPACEWVSCKHAGGEAIQNCTPVSSEVQRSFAGAVVQDIVIRGKRAAARFSNGVTVRLEEFLGGGGWWIARVGAGRKFFE
jgi:hypothetical protein